MTEFAATFALVGLTITAVGYAIFTLLARHGLIRNAEDEVRKMEATLAREREAGAREQALKMRVEELEVANVQLAGAIQKLGMKVEPYRAPSGMDPEVHGEMVDSVGVGMEV
jgi:hypothetical protein